jgi:hypothetical protein
MDGADAYAVPANPWLSLVRGYFSPATLFLLLNVVIGTIALTSRSHRRDEEHEHCYAPPPPPAPIARTSSIVERLRSLGLYRFSSGDFPPEYNHHHLSATTADGASDASSAQDAHHQCAKSQSEQAARPPPAVRNTDRNAETVTCRAVKKSTTEVRKMERAPAQPRLVQRAPPRASAPVRAVAAREVEEGDAAVSVDARADDFINRFRQQLQLQRLNSLLNYKEMLNRGL